MINGKPPEKMSQNIFDYATSELSQDAFICLLISWFDSENEEEKTISKTFISELYKEFTNKKICEIDSIELKRQYHRIDVYFIVTCQEGEKIKFVIEDKTWTEPHSDQLERYVKKVSEAENNSEEIIKIFFKTGHITEKDECMTQKAGYKIIDVPWIYRFLKKHESTNMIYKQFKDFIEKEFYKKIYDDNGIKIKLEDRKVVDIKSGYVQYDIVKSIKDNVMKNSSCIEPYIKHIRNGKSWETQWTCAKNDKDLIFVKISKRQNKYCLRLVQYAIAKQDSEQNSRREKYWQCVQSLCEKCKEGKSKKNSRESDIALLFFKDANSKDANSKDAESIAAAIDSFSKLVIDFRKNSDAGI